MVYRSVIAVSPVHRAPFAMVQYVWVCSPLDEQVHDIATRKMKRLAQPVLMHIKVDFETSRVPN
jgi:hypothetical protein